MRIMSIQSKLEKTLRDFQLMVWSGSFREIEIVAMVGTRNLEKDVCENVCRFVGIRQWKRDCGGPHVLQAPEN